MKRASSSTLDDLAAQLLIDIQERFSATPQISKETCLARADGDDWSVERIVRILDHRLWSQVSFRDFLDCGPDELKSYLSKRAFLYYLPGLLTCVLRSLRTVPRTRLHEVIALMLLPTTADYEDVWGYFGDGMFSGWGTPFFMRSTARMIENTKYVYDSLDPDQRACVARYIEITESFGLTSPNPEFLSLLSRFADFWRRAPLMQPLSAGSFP